MTTEDQLRRGMELLGTQPGDALWLAYMRREQDALLLSGAPTPPGALTWRDFCLTPAQEAEMRPVPWTGHPPVSRWVGEPYRGPISVVGTLRRWDLPRGPP